MVHLGRSQLVATPVFLGFPGGSDSKASACSVGDLGSGLVALSMQGVPVQSQVRDLRSHMPCGAAKKKKKLVKMMNSVGAQSLQLCPTLRQLSVTPWTRRPGSSVHRDSSGKNTGLGCHALLQRISLTQGPNPNLLCWQADFLPRVPWEAQA